MKKITDKEWNRMIKEDQENMKNNSLTLFLKKVFPRLSIKQGQAIWWLLENRSLYFKGKDLSGGFRYNGACIAKVVGKRTNYMSFYCSAPNEQVRKEFRSKKRFTIKYALELYEKIKLNGGKIWATGGYAVPLYKYNETRRSK